MLVYLVKSFIASILRNESLHSVCMYSYICFIMSDESLDSSFSSEESINVEDWLEEADEIEVVKRTIFFKK